MQRAHRKRLLEEHLWVCIRCELLLICSLIPFFFMVLLLYSNELAFTANAIAFAAVWSVVIFSLKMLGPGSTAKVLDTIKAVAVSYLKRRPQTEGTTEGDHSG